MNIKDLTALAKSIAPVVRDHVSTALDRFRKELDIDGRLEGVRDEVKAELKAFREIALTKEELLAGAREIIDSHSVDMKAYFVELVSDIPLPDDPLTIEEITKHIAIPHDDIAELRKQIGEAKGAALTLDAVEEKARELIDSAGTDIKLYIAEQIAALPPAPEIPEIEPLDYEEIAKNLAIPEDELAEIVDDRVRLAVSQMPTPKDGESVSLERVQAMVDAAVAKAMESVRQPQDGKDADPEEIQMMVDSAVSAIEIKHGVDGKDGADGRGGKDADPELIQRMVAETVAGIEIQHGKDGRDGVDGKDGAPGRDGLDIDIIPSIDVDKVYPRGTYARHMGGLWRSHTTTDGIRGWECVVDGYPDLDVSQGDDPRDVTVKVSKTTGKSVDTVLHFPVVIDKGTHDPEKSYRMGDGTSYGGQFWIAQKDDPEGRPGTNDGWRLAVKKGRDGKQGDPGPKGEKGIDGKNGRDLTQVMADGRKY